MLNAADQALHTWGQEEEASFAAFRQRMTEAHDRFDLRSKEFWQEKLSAYQAYTARSAAAWAAYGRALVAL